MALHREPEVVRRRVVPVLDRGVALDPIEGRVDLARAQLLAVEIEESLLGKVGRIEVRLPLLV